MNSFGMAGERFLNQPTFGQRFNMKVCGKFHFVNVIMCFCKQWIGDALHQRGIRLVTCGECIIDMRMRNVRERARV